MSKIERNLTNDERKFITIPKEIIRNDDKKLALAFAYFATHRNLYEEVIFTVPHLVAWCGYKVNPNKGATNDQFIEAIITLDDLGYIEVDTSLLSSRKDLVTAKFDFEYTTIINWSERTASMNKKKESKDYKKFNGSFAIIYLDEIKKIVSHQDSNRNFSPASLFSLFCYLRSMIYNRSETNGDNPRSRPETYNCKYDDIAEALDMSKVTVGKLLYILRAELGIIQYRTIHRMLGNGKYTTLQTVFCNQYKRYKGRLVADGESYYDREIGYTGDNLVTYYNNMYKNKFAFSIDEQLG